MRRLHMYAMTVASVAWTTSASATSVAINAEGVNIYPNNDIQAGADEARSFYQGMTSPPSTPWTQGNLFTDANVFDQDFVDSDLNSNGDDEVSFDAPHTAIAYFGGHGTCDDGFPDGCLFGGMPQQCRSSADCPFTSNPFGNGSGGVCRHVPGEQDAMGRYGFCAYQSDRFLIVNGSNSAFGQQVDYSASGRSAFGESPESGAWRGAGTNGGANFVVLSVSNGVEPGFEAANLLQAFAGVHMIASTMPVSGDYQTTGNRGSDFASAYFANPFSRIADAWKNTINQLSGVGSACGSNGVTNGGFGGYNGCGCNVVATVGVDINECQQHLLESWSDLQNDATFDARGNGIFTDTILCNFDTTIDPILL